MTAEELLERERGEGKSELIEGEYVEMSPTGEVHFVVLRRITEALVAYFGANPVGDWWGGELGFVLERDPDTVLAPDLAVTVPRQPLSAAIAARGFSERRPILVIEVKSPHETEAQIAQKLGIYLRAGVQQVWWVRPSSRQATIYTRDDDPLTVDIHGELGGVEALPGFSIRLSELFN